MGNLNEYGGRVCECTNHPKPTQCERCGGWAIPLINTEADWGLECVDPEPVLAGSQSVQKISGYIRARLLFEDAPLRDQYDKYGNPPFTRQHFINAVQTSMRIWNFAIDGVEFHCSRRSPDFVIRWSPMEKGRQGVVPYATTQPGRLSLASNYPFWNRGMLHRVIVHELGHLLKIPHLPRNDRGVMQAGLGFSHELSESDLVVTSAAGYKLSQWLLPEEGHEV